MKNTKRIFSSGQKLAVWVFLALTLTVSTSIAQVRINSPYSMFGPGEVKGTEYFRNMPMGGIAQAYRSNVSVNYINPASYTAIDSLSFVFEATVFSHLYKQTYAGENQISNYSALGNLNFAFPVTRWWSVAAGLLPYSQKGYKISDSQSQDGTFNFLYEGNGGINQVYLGHGFKLFQGMSVGVNAAYLFGKSEDLMSVAADTIGIFRTAWSYADDIDGLLLTFGAQYEAQLGEQRKMTIGATFSPEAELNINRNRRILRDLPGVLGTDTLSDVVMESGKMVIPHNLGAGVFFTFNPQFSAGLDYQTQNWSNFSKFGREENLNDSYQVRFGAVYNPTIETYSGFLSRWEYRAGFRYGQSFLKVNDNDFSEFGISFGIAVPVRRSNSALNIGFEYAQRSSGQENLISEDFFRFNIGVNIYERWFVRRRFF